MIFNYMIWRGAILYKKSAVFIIGKAYGKKFKIVVKALCCSPVRPILEHASVI